MTRDDRLYVARIVSDERESLIDIFVSKKKHNQSLEIRIESESMNPLRRIDGLSGLGPLDHGSHGLGDIRDDDRYDGTSNDRSDDDHDQIDADDRQTCVYSASLHQIDEWGDEYGDECGYDEHYDK